MGLFNLFKPAWQSKNVSKATKEVERITDEEKLKMIAKNTNSGAVLYAVVKKITDEVFLKEIALNNPSNDRVMNWADWEIGVREEAIRKINDEVLMKKIVLEDSNLTVRKVAAKKLTDQDVFINIAKNVNEHRWLRTDCVEKIESQTVLTDIVKNEMNVDVRLAALKKIENKELLKKHVYFDYEYSPRIRFFVLKEIPFDASLLKSIAAIDPAYEVRKRAIKLLNITVPSKMNSYYVSNELASRSVFNSMMDSAKSGIVKPYSPMYASSALTALTNPEPTREMRIYAAKTIAEDAIKYISYNVNLGMEPDLELLSHENAIEAEVKLEYDFAGIQPLIASYLKNIGIGLMGGTKFPTKAYRLVYLLSTNGFLLNELFTLNSRIYEYQQIRDAAAIMLADNNILPYDAHIDLESKFLARKDNNKLASTSSNFENNEIKQTTRFPLFTKSGVCDVCNASLSERIAYTVPNSVFYNSQKYREQLRNSPMAALMGAPMDDAYFSRMQTQDHSQGSAVCESCIHLF